jgi:hypothetical protein
MDWRVGLRRALVITGASIGALGLAVELVNARTRGHETLVAFFSLSFEHNLPTWYSSALLLACAIALGSVAIRTSTRRAQWWALAGVFAYLSLDESVEIHEHLGGLLRLHGPLYYSWIVPAAAFVVAFVAVFARFLASLPRATRVRFIAAGIVYVGGALVMELPLGWWAERHGDENLGYALIDWVEEMLELTGASMFLLAVLRHSPDGVARE